MRESRACKYYTFILVALCMGLVGCKSNTEKKSMKVDEKKVFTYQNPIKNGIVGGIRDCQIIEDNGKYYLMGTSAPFFGYRTGDATPGIKIYSSDDLLNWKFEKLLIDRSKLDSTDWYLDRFWAPEIHIINDKYYLTFNCSNESKTKNKLQGLHSGIAVSDEILGDYTVLTHDEPFRRGNDLTLFEDDDGKVYAFNNHSKTIFVTEVDMENVKPIGEPKPCISAGKLENGDWDGVSIEGAYCIKRNGQYYLFYSSWSRGYEIGYATADHPLGPWTKYEQNPIYGGQNEESCKKYGIEFSGDPDNPWARVGHNEVFEGPDGRLWLSCHGILKNETVPYLVIDPIDFVDGAMKIDGPTYTTQTITF
jgi:xylan 1,4-beta-xylosidase